LEESLSDVNSTLLSKETDLEDTVRQLKSAQDQFLNLQSGYNKLLAENDALKRKIDILNNTTTSNDSEIERLKKKLSQVAALNKEHEMQLEKLRTEHDEMERTCRERAKSIEQLENTNESLEGKLERITQELQILKDK
uniref:HOOK domain-containing protein n=1 Tax=Anisakis simplex TaxID=6269 RepID=A0A0M3JL17_ANISI